MIDLGRSLSRHLHSAGVRFVLAWPVVPGICTYFLLTMYEIPLCPQWAR